MKEEVSCGGIEPHAHASLRVLLQHLSICQTQGFSYASGGPRATTVGYDRGLTGMERRGLLLLCSLLRLAFAQTEFCDSDCQNSQYEALVVFGQSTGLQGFAYQEGLPSWGGPHFNMTYSVPSYCLWPGVLCCGPNKAIIMPVATASSLQLNCLVPYGVAVIFVSGFPVVTGTLPQEDYVWQALAPTVQALLAAGGRLHLLATCSCLTGTVAVAAFSACWVLRAIWQLSCAIPG